MIQAEIFFPFNDGSINLGYYLRKMTIYVTF